MSSLRSFIISAVFLFTFISTAQEGLMVAMGPTVTSSTSLTGINLRAYLGTSPTFCFGPEVSVFPYQTTSDEYETNLFEVNFNAHYVFELAHRFGVYPLSGFNYTNENERSLMHSDEVEKHNALGINYGLGTHYSINRVLLFAEFKGVISELSDEFFTIGAVILLKKPQKKLHHEQ
ncbi:hypothetical protein [Croceitalea rosinachiae]|uniref:Outer membrane protein beta-barrel domain-containing protein n=1 Tax=Croceitalea rosinachiae TaxID=3075596 RepID=A0ABU3A5J7_9FLAO|nr:hypothetical protein [Croceitalea sp. F388]MDT0605434.1 hypothetical protein [Croceitalea sp. F388]